ncbi:hypothetical protein DAEQUDRAFT_170821 [Daedalea quercina L-15889]|uniref:Uncharacterized protein n=1 Tax=Daedalea quercina L-15889 TaxID=1314783 RepID=A0A165RKD0_9APHY|nr:hypothetical protein DAEQUDRAFT_170821 [Daedalea quercina L-15889]
MHATTRALPTLASALSLPAPSVDNMMNVPPPICREHQVRVHLPGVSATNASLCNVQRLARELPTIIKDRSQTAPVLGSTSHRSNCVAESYMSRSTEGLLSILTGYQRKEIVDTHGAQHMRFHEGPRQDPTCRGKHICRRSR